MLNPTGNPTLTTTGSPYVGPRPFEQQDSGRFFGRERETNELLSLVVAHRVTVLYAPSGAGKTSLLKAGLIPHLETKGFEVLPPTRVLGPTESDKLDIANIYAFQALAGLEGEEADPAYLAQLSIADYLQQQGAFLDKYGLPAPRVLIFDQFEELFTAYPARWAEREAFFSQLQTALETVPLLRIVFSLREDYLAQLEPFAPTMPDNLSHRFRLERMTPEAALTAVRGPLQNTARTFTDSAAKKLVEELQKIRVEGPDGTTTAIGKFIEPVQLQVVCQNLWQSLPPHITTITEKELAAYGDVTKALAQFYVTAIQQTIRQPDVHLKESDLREWFEKQLITPAETRSLVFQDKETGLTGGIPNEAIRHLDRQHIIRGEVRSGSRWYELTHDRFIDPILKANQSWRDEVRSRRLRRGGVALGTLVIVAICFLAGLVTLQYFDSQAMAAAVEATSTVEQAMEAASQQTRTIEQNVNQTAVAQQQATATAQQTIAAGFATRISIDEAQKDPELYLSVAETLFPTWTAENRLESLVTLVEFNDDTYTAGALDLFYSLSEAEQEAIFKTSAEVDQDGLATLIELILKTKPSNNAYLDTLSSALSTNNADDDNGGNGDRTSTLITEIDDYITAWESAEQGNYVTAVESYSDLMAADQQNPVLYLERGRVYTEIGSAESAANDFIEALALLAENTNRESPPVWETDIRVEIGTAVCTSQALRQLLQSDPQRYVPTIISQVPQNCIFWISVWPTELTFISQPFRANPEVYSQFNLPGHEGIDIQAPSGSAVYAVADGVVEQVIELSENHRYGIAIYLRHTNGYRTLYAQLQETFVVEGDQVTAGSLIALSGNTGNSFGAHLHFSLYQDGASTSGQTDYPSDIIDPTPFLTPLLGVTGP